MVELRHLYSYVRAQSRVTQCRVTKAGSDTLPIHSDHTAAAVCALTRLMAAHKSHATFKALDDT